MSLRAAVFASGRGSNFRVLVDHAARSTDAPHSWRVVLLVSDRDDAGALELARDREVPSVVIPVKGRPPGDVSAETLERLRASEVDVVLLAGYLKLVPPAVVEAFRGRMLNIHPALLPSFGGKGMYGRHVHEAVLRSGARVTGPTVHFVDERYDRGPILAQWPVPVLPGDDPDAVARRVNEAEHHLYPAAADALARAVAESRDPEPIPGSVSVAPDGAGPHFVLEPDVSP